MWFVSTYTLMWCFKRVFPEEGKGSLHAGDPAAALGFTAGCQRLGPQTGMAKVPEGAFFFHWGCLLRFFWKSQPKGLTVLIILENQDTWFAKTQKQWLCENRICAGLCWGRKKKKKKAVDWSLRLPKDRNNSFLWPFLETEVNACTYFLNKTFQCGFTDSRFL